MHAGFLWFGIWPPSRNGPPVLGGAPEGGEEWVEELGAPPFGFFEVSEPRVRNLFDGGDRRRAGRPYAARAAIG
jgi:hypothetical protein